jgi:hypothetical protein
LLDSSSSSSSSSGSSFAGRWLLLDEYSVPFLPLSSNPKTISVFAHLASIQCTGCTRVVLGCAAQPAKMGLPNSVGGHDLSSWCSFVEVYSLLP